MFGSKFAHIAQEKCAIERSEYANRTFSEQLIPHQCSYFMALCGPEKGLAHYLTRLVLILLYVLRWRAHLCLHALL